MRRLVVRLQYCGRGRPKAPAKMFHFHLRWPALRPLQVQAEGIPQVQFGRAVMVLKVGQGKQAPLLPALVARIREYLEFKERL